jgi:predicted regulator of Ras-like GTPase activity (Roadblock/LC7/MglB family)
MLRAVLEEAGRRLPGCEAAVLVGTDGMVVEKWASGDAPPLEELAAELTPLIRAAETLGRNTGGGGFTDVTVRLARWSCTVIPVNEETFVVLIADHDSVPGRIRYEASRTAGKLEAALQ